MSVRSAPPPQRNPPGHRTAAPRQVCEAQAAGQGPPSASGASVRRAAEPRTLDAVLTVRHLPGGPPDAAASRPISKCHALDRGQRPARVVDSRRTALRASRAGVTQLAECLLPKHVLGHTSAHLPFPHRPPIDRPGHSSSVPPGISNVGQSLGKSTTSRSVSSPRRGWCSCWPHGRPVGPAARPDRRFATGHCRPTSTRTLSSARTDVGWSVTTTWARG